MLGRTTTSQINQMGGIAYQVDHKTYNLLSLEQTKKCFDIFRPDYVIHAAGYNGNIQFNKKQPADIFYRTAQMGLNVLYTCVQFNVKKVISFISSCAYPGTTNILHEEMFWQGKPDDSVDAHGFSKRIILEYSKQLYKQYGLISIGMICNTVYGPYDSYQLHKTKVVGSVIKKIIDAHKNKQSEVSFWGTGSPRRELIYCDDVAKCCLQTLRDYDDVMLPLNVGTGQDITIQELVNIVTTIIGYKGNIVWQTHMPDGQMKKLLDVSRMNTLFSKKINFTPLIQGLTKTIRWYEENTNV